ncbi:hypothetical protein IFM89_028052 [Coptis chinensis]|uniref:Uncharacterized protein n=1 Tax=Coptis chinensis TaxID=261450 RepID=A0A835HDK8_9MAGN|nr:hypothetical protein IFM89_028052 [Coptis chinensis]
MCICTNGRFLLCRLWMFTLWILGQERHVALDLLLCLKYLGQSILEGRVITLEKVVYSVSDVFSHRQLAGWLQGGEEDSNPRKISRFEINSCNLFVCFIMLKYFHHPVRHRSPSYFSYSRRHRSSSDESSEKERDRSYSPYYVRARYYSRSLSPYSRSPVSRLERSYTPYYRSSSRIPDMISLFLLITGTVIVLIHLTTRSDHSYSPYFGGRERSYSPYDRRGDHSISPNDSRSRNRSVSKSVTPRSRRSSRKNYSRGATPRPKSRRYSTRSPSVSHSPSYSTRRRC